MSIRSHGPHHSRSASSWPTSAATTCLMSLRSGRAPPPDVLGLGYWSRAVGVVCLIALEAATFSSYWSQRLPRWWCGEPSAVSSPSRPQPSPQPKSPRPCSRQSALPERVPIPVLALVLSLCVLGEGARMFPHESRPGLPQTNNAATFSAATTNKGCRHPIEGPRPTQSDGATRPAIRHMQGTLNFF